MGFLASWVVSPDLLSYGMVMLMIISFCHTDFTDFCGQVGMLPWYCSPPGSTQVRLAAVPESHVSVKASEALALLYILGILVERNSFLKYAP